MGLNIKVLWPLLFLLLEVSFFLPMGSAAISAPFFTPQRSHAVPEEGDEYPVVFPDGITHWWRHYAPVRSRLCKCLSHMFRSQTIPALTMSIIQLHQARQDGQLAILPWNTQAVKEVSTISTKAEKLISVHMAHFATSQNRNMTDIRITLTQFIWWEGFYQA